MQGKLIVFEGSDGSGKTTQVELLRAYFEKKNTPHIAFDFPRYADSFHAKIVAQYLSGEYGDPTKQSPYLASLAYALDRLATREEIYYALNDGKIVLANRYVSSNKAYQAAKLPVAKRKEFFNWLDELEYSVNKVPREDLVIFLFVPIEFSMKLAKEREKKFGGTDLHEDNRDYQRQVEKTYVQLAKNPHWIKIDCIADNSLRSKADIHKQVISVLKIRKII